MSRTIGLRPGQMERELLGAPGKGAAAAAASSPPKASSSKSSQGGAAEPASPALSSASAHAQRAHANFAVSPLHHVAEVCGGAEAAAAAAAATAQPVVAAASSSTTVGCVERCGASAAVRALGLLRPPGNYRWRCPSCQQRDEARWIAAEEPAHVSEAEAMLYAER